MDPREQKAIEIAAKFRSLRSKTDIATVNGALCKILCHNLVVLIHEIHELGIDASFVSHGLPAR